jgi:hypothetical protein
MKARIWSTILGSAAASALVWALPPWLAGQREPWDADGLFYIVTLIVAGSLADLLTPKPL